MRHIRIYNAVDAVARHRSIRGAANGLAISPSALNRQVQALEEELGVELFERLPRGVRLSTAGEIYLRAFRAHIAELERASAQISDLSGLRAGVVRLGVGPELMSSFARRVVADYQAEFPRLDMEIKPVSCDAVGSALQDFDVDLFVGVNPIMNEAVKTIHAEETSVVCIGAMSDLPPGPVRASTLADVPLAVNNISSGLRLGLDAMFSSRSLHVRYALVEEHPNFEAPNQSDKTLHLKVSHDLDAAVLSGSGKQAKLLHSADAPSLYIHVAQLKSRVLPVGAAKLGERMISALVSFSHSAV